MSNQIAEAQNTVKESKGETLRETEFQTGAKSALGAEALAAMTGTNPLRNASESILQTGVSATTRQERNSSGDLPNITLTGSDRSHENAVQAQDDPAAIPKAVEKADSRIDDTNLGIMDKMIAKDIEHSILKGDAKHLAELLHEFKDDPHKLDSIMRAVQYGLADTGIILSWGVGSTMLPGQKEFHDLGSLNIYNRGDKNCVEIATNGGSCVGGPVKWSKDGQSFQDYGNALSESPTLALQAMGKDAARKK
jgi:hypothetical protein